MFSHDVHSPSIDLDRTEQTLTSRAYLSELESQPVLHVFSRSAVAYPSSSRSKGAVFPEIDDKQRPIFLEVYWQEDGVSAPQIPWTPRIQHHLPVS